ncbi:MAG: hypothetical protein SFX72_22715 [Isosphaeraceae bacterium]|nr:hypothetical protein [Isosphaeraceae bacterium]
MGASLQEKSVWVQTLGLVVGLGGYFAVAGRMLASGVRVPWAYVPLFVVSVVFMVVILIAGLIVAALTSRDEAADERDRLISWRAEHDSGWLLATGVLAAMTALVAGVAPILVAHLLLLSLFLSQLLSFLLRILYYRRGI